jgi:hypothetical protein
MQIAALLLESFDECLLDAEFWIFENWNRTQFVFVRVIFQGIFCSFCNASKLNQVRSTIIAHMLVDWSWTRFRVICYTGTKMITNDLTWLNPAMAKNKIKDLTINMFLVRLLWCFLLLFCFDLFKRGRNVPRENNYSNCCGRSMQE